MQSNSLEQRQTQSDSPSRSDRPKAQMTKFLRKVCCCGSRGCGSIEKDDDASVRSQKLSPRKRPEFISQGITDENNSFRSWRRTINSMRSLTDQLTERTLPLLQMQLEHPFLRALADGTLPSENFEFYIRQDTRYLDKYREVLAHCLTKTTDAIERQKFAELSMECTKAEQDLHDRFAQQFGLSREEMKTTPLAPTNHAYTCHLLDTAVTGTLAETLAALLPCAWIYCRIGQHLLKEGSPAADHPYRDWIMTYVAPESELLATWLGTTLDKYAKDLPSAQLRHLEDLYLTSVHYEYLFWEMAWKKEAWPAELTHIP